MTPAPTATMIEVLETSQLYTLEDKNDRNSKSSHTRVVFRQSGVTFHATSSLQLNMKNVDVNQLENVQLMPLEFYCPRPPSKYTTAPDPTLFFVKRTKLVEFDGGKYLARLVLQELETCEIIRKKPHENIAQYFGCEIINGRITGLCFRGYQQTLMQWINPTALNKADFILLIRADVRTILAAHYLVGIERGIRHLHSLGIAHNDINPSNVMITRDDLVPVIIDFDSSCRIGTELDRPKRTYGWYDPEVLISQTSNDFDALAELRVWLTGSSPEEYRFGV